MTDTIFAAATAPGRAAVAVVRLSGPKAADALRRLCGRPPAPRRASVRRLRDAGGALLDEALVLWLPGPASYTGEDSVELHLHGGPAVVAGVLDALSALGLRLGEPGEFTRRAFENGRLDLAQAEGVADLIEAETEAQRRQALDQVGGRLSGAQARWREALIEALAVFEAAVDFPDEEIPADVASRAAPILSPLITELRAAAAETERGERVRSGYRIALMGAPNAGKSTLLNALARREAAIVTATAGTTRDIIEVPLVLAGYKVILADTAGLRETADEIEAEGVRRAQAWGAEADLRIWLKDGAAEGEEGLPGRPGAQDLVLVTKRDLVDLTSTGEGRAFSAKLAEDLVWLEETLAGRVSTALGGAEPPAATRLRHRDLLAEAVARLERAAASDIEPELAAEDVRLAARALDRITGRIGSEDVLDRVFASFCIGK
ncbi:tRNA uridine-5-carboxymethylaminomethyl(34) synthesis GTPase MnmE [Phenylobacterium sp.]|jgi:tRNA modification GTPase|uniref:tRNA uridine-5-carboxymethylaminomethyl(34) synthesis GTPase MnmE n=1 Tax=Phenylobacterium sp. TaxID=1871053 RepID=UPI000C8EFB1C|nr:tRNA uridine-5-carboxymethylaminomethyl(34) synthesis GTPase MnmE [Phenylobacterium sp.]MAK81501.1 tRNA uridine-5-carboxymethylaminomethyl(34) synthesis GTPase MnmE [Phenylobacterium sp.]|tara:strand:- start:14264 stop:15568 length:1305 start_codon:yes stop_codon:yes gene_type:complete